MFPRKAMFDDGPRYIISSWYSEISTGRQLPKDAQSSSGIKLTAPIPSMESSAASALSRVSSLKDAVSSGSESMDLDSLGTRATGTGSSSLTDDGSLFSSVVTRFSSSFIRSSISDRYL